jgi:hypothetical protein
VDFGDFGVDLSWSDVVMSVEGYRRLQTGPNIHIVGCVQSVWHLDMV